MFLKEMKEKTFNCWKQISSLDTPTPKTTLVEMYNFLYNIEFIVRWLQNLKNFGTIKIGNKYVWKWLVKLNLNILFH
jgi:hypothetical protein